MELVVRHGDREESVRVERHDDGYRVSVGETTYEVDAIVARGELRSLIHAGRQHEVAVHPSGDGRYRVSAEGLDTEVELMDPLTHLARVSHEAAGGGAAQTVTAYMPGRVVKLLVEEGQEVESGQGLVVLEAMKMENELQAEGAGTVAKILVEEGQAVEGGDALIEIG